MKTQTAIAFEKLHCSHEFFLSLFPSAANFSFFIVLNPTDNSFSHIKNSLDLIPERNLNGKSSKIFTTLLWLLIKKNMHKHKHTRFLYSSTLQQRNKNGVITK